MNKILRFTLRFLFLALVFHTSIFSQTDRTIGVLPIDNEGSAGDAWLGKGMELLLEEKLGEMSAIAVYEKETLDRILRKLNVTGSKQVDPRMAFAIGKASGIEILFLGSYKLAGDALSARIRLVSTYTGSPIFEERLEGNVANIFDFIAAVVEKGLETMQVPRYPDELAKIKSKPTSSIKAFELFCRAYLEIERQSSLEGIAGNFQRALMEDPQFLEAQFNLGVIYYNFKFYEKATQQFDEIISKDSQYYKAYFGRGVIRYLNKDYPAALREFRTCLSIQPEHDRSYYYMGIVYTRLDSLGKAIQALEKSIDINPNYAPAYYQLGFAEMGRGWYKRAISSQTRATQLNPDFYRAHNALGEAYYAVNLYEEAIIEFKKAIDLKPGFATAHFNLGNAIYRRGALAEIVDAFWSILEMQYGAAEGTNGHTTNQAVFSASPFEGLEELREKSRIRDSSKILQEMVAAYRTALSYDDRFYEASYNLALTYENLEKPDSAEFFYKLAIQQKPDLSQAHMRLGKLYEKRKQYHLALKAFKEVVRHDPDYFSSNPRLGESYRYVNIVELVLNENMDILSRNPNDPAALETVGKIYLSLGRFGQAEEYYQKLVTITPNDPLAQQTLRRIRRQLQKM